MVERFMESVSNTMLLPWSRERGENARFGIILLVLALVFVPLALLIPRMQLPQPTQAQLEAVPAHLAHLVQVPKPKPKPVPKVLPPPVPKPKPKEKPIPLPKPEAKAKPKPKPQPEKPHPVVHREPTPKAASQQTTQQARAVAQKSGLLALQSQLSQMQDMAQPDQQPATIKTMGQKTQAQSDDQQVQAVSVAEATSGSGGIRDTSKPQQQVALANRQAERVAPEHHQKHHRKTAKADNGPGGRSMENIRRVFDRNKSALYVLYNMALRRNPLLQGKVLLEVVIQPDGSVSSCKVVSSELNDPQLEKQIAERVELFNFGKERVKPRTVKIPINFLPPS